MQVLHEVAKNNLETESDSIKNQSIQIDQDFDKTETLVNIMDEIRKVRANEYGMRLKIQPIKDMYKLIDSYKENLEIT